MEAMKMRDELRTLYWISSTQFGFDPRRFVRSLRGVIPYLTGLRHFRCGYRGTLNLMPCLHDRFEEGGATSSEYFWQDLIVARWICNANPRKHVDIGSRVDGFVAHVASFRDLEVLDVRPISACIPGVQFRQADLMSAESIESLAPGGIGYCDSLSCLHVLEHLGLGRYGDPIDPDGFRRGLENLARLLQPGGVLYLSTPVGRERVEFNANRVFDPTALVRAAEGSGLRLDKLASCTGQSGVTEVGAETFERAMSEWGRDRYRLAIMQFTKSDAVGERH
jgi:SAM-dependent methyltransferase